MLVKAIAAFMSFIMSVTGITFVSPDKFLDSLSEIFFGLPYSDEAVNGAFFSGIDDGDVIAMNEESGFLKDKLIVFLNKDVDFLDKIDVFKNAGGVIAGWCTALDLYVLSFTAMNYEKMISECERLQRIDGIDLAIPAITRKIEAQATPNDPFYDETDIYPVDQEWDEIEPEGRNWWLEAIDARQAWDYDAYFGDVKTGILDDGFYLDHPELKGKISFPDSKTASRNAYSDHGTHVAGIIAAERNNALGISGICPDAQLVCVDWSPESLQFWSTNLAIYFGFSKLVQSGAKTVNLSLGSSGSLLGMKLGVFEKYIDTAAYSRSMASLLDKGYDFVVVQSAGNGNYLGIPVDSRENGLFCSIDENNAFLWGTNATASDILDRIIVVGAASTDYEGNYIQATYSNVGSDIDLFAPGTDIYSSAYTYPYETLSGTSMSAPVVTGIASLVWSVNPDFTGKDVKEIICSSTDAVATPAADTVALNDEMQLGLELADHKLVNARLSVEEALLRTNENFGRAEGKLNLTASGVESIKYNEKEYTVLSDGSYSIVAQKGAGVAKALGAGGEVLYEFVIEIK